MFFICNNKEQIWIIFPLKNGVFDACGGFVKTEDSNPSQVLTLQSLLMLMVLQLQQKVNGTILISKYYCCI